MLHDPITRADTRADVLRARHGALSGADLIAATLRDPDAGRLALVSSFGAESVVLLHMVAIVAPDTPVLFIDTQMLFAETLEYQHRLARTLDLRDIRVIRPDSAELAAEDPDDTLHRVDPDACCALRKSRPLEAALRGFDGWITGRKRHQADTRTGLPRFEVATGRVRFNPLADWSAADLSAYMDRHALPRHPLTARGYPSIGCAPCTSPVAAGEDARAGRWRGQEKTECGIHFIGGKPVRVPLEAKRENAA